MQRSSAEGFLPLDMDASIIGLVTQRKPEGLSVLLKFLLQTPFSNIAVCAQGKKLKLASLTTSCGSHQPGLAVLVLSALFHVLFTLPFVLA